MVMKIEYISVEEYFYNIRPYLRDTKNNLSLTYGKLN